MRQYENEVQKIKNEVLTLLAKSAFNQTLLEDVHKIPKLVNPGPDGRFRCCVHHERAITSERIEMAFGGNQNACEIVEVLPSACDQCLVDRFVVTEACRGCLAHRCVKACPVDAIQMQNGKAIINQKKCVECGKCKAACPYSAIADVMRPCLRGCPTDAISVDETKRAIIDYDACISCGACVYNCPCGAIYAMLAPAFSTQFQYVPLENVIEGIKLLGFRDVVEVALGADLVIKHEVDEISEHLESHPAMTSSCCPGFVNLIEHKFPDLLEMVSGTVSPMIATARLIKSIDPSSVVVFIGPCIAKKHEKKRSDDVEFVLTFEELAALIDAKELDLETLKGAPLNNASYYGRQFAATGGVSKAVQHHYENKTDQSIETISCDGIKACEKTLTQLKYKKLNQVFIEGMACQGGCIKGPVTMHHGPKDLKSVELYSKKALEDDAIESTAVFNKITIDLNRKRR